jgi:hypothetical protein
MLSRLPDGTVEGDPAARVLACYQLYEADLGTDLGYCDALLADCVATLPDQ